MAHKKWMCGVITTQSKTNPMSTFHIEAWYEGLALWSTPIFDVRLTHRIDVLFEGSQMDACMGAFSSWLRITNSLCLNSIIGVLRGLLAIFPPACADKDNIIAFFVMASAKTAPRFSCQQDSTFDTDQLFRSSLSNLRIERMRRPRGWK